MHFKKRDFPLNRVREHLETGPIVLVTSRHERRSNIMTMGWHMMMQFSPALFACYIWEGNRSWRAVRASRECVINIPTVELLDQVVAIGNSHADDGEKFAAAGLTAGKSKRLKAPLIDECYASFECRLFDDKMVKKYRLFIWEIVKAHVASVKEPRTLHYRGRGTFMIGGEEIDCKRKFKSEISSCLPVPHVALRNCGAYDLSPGDCCKYPWPRSRLGVYPFGASRPMDRHQQCNSTGPFCGQLAMLRL